MNRPNWKPLERREAIAQWWMTFLSGIALGLYVAFLIARHS
jgi:succinate dehydrogenase hydrophobic anchor subunit